MGETIDMEWKGWESIECWTHYVAVNFVTLTLTFQGHILKNSQLTLKEREESIWCWTHYVSLNFDLPMTFTLDFQSQILRELYLTSAQKFVILHMLYEVVIGTPVAPFTKLQRLYCWSLGMDK